MNINEAIALANVPPRELIVEFQGSEYAIMLPAHDMDGNSVYYTQLFTRRLEMGLIRGDSGILAGAYQWYRK